MVIRWRCKRGLSHAKGLEDGFCDVVTVALSSGLFDCQAQKLEGIVGVCGLLIWREDWFLLL